MSDTPNFVPQFRQALRRMHEKFSISQKDCMKYRKQIIQNASDKKGLQVAVKDGMGRLGTNWVTIDKFDESDVIDFNYDVMDMPFENDEFDAVYCQSVLEHVPYPQQAIAEMTRVLKPGGEIWIQLPFILFYHEYPSDYWRVSPDGMRVWMEGFEEYACGSFSYTGSPFTVTTFFYGRKPLAT